MNYRKLKKEYAKKFGVRMIIKLYKKTRREESNREESFKTCNC